MATGVKGGFNPSRTRGSGPDCQSYETFDITNQYATTLFYGAPVKLGSNQTVELASNGDTVLGVFMGNEYTNADGELSQRKIWPASTDSESTPKAFVDSRPVKTYSIKANGTVAQVKPGQLYAVEGLGAGSVLTGRSAEQVKVLADATGDVDLSSETDIGANVTGIIDNDSFKVNTSAGTPVTITIADGDGGTELLSKLNAVDNILATLTSDGFLNIEATDGNDLVLAEDTNTPLSALGISAGTITPTVAAGSAMVVVQKVIDADERHLEVAFAKHQYRDNEA